MRTQTLDRELWRKVEGFEIDERGADGRGPELTFEARLAKEQGWTREFASRVVGEYRRYVYLAVEGGSGHPVSPSEAVDEAWHLHLMYTRSYWERLCGEVLKRPLHHEPSRGGGREERKFEGWYLKTLDRYHEVFGEEAPRDIWPRGGGVEGRKAEVVRRSWWKSGTVRKEAMTVAAVGAVGLGMVGCVAATGSAVDPLVMLLAVVALFGALGVAAVMGARESKRSEKREEGGSGCGTSSSGCGGESHHSDHDGGGDSGGSSDGGSSCGSSGCGGGGD